MVKPLTPVEHVSNAEKNFLSQYSDTSKFKGFVDSFLSPLDDLEQQVTLFNEQLTLPQAIGQNLNLWGIILNAGTRPTDDESFRILLYALIGAYNSEGRPADIRALILSVLQADSIFIDDNGQATFSFTVLNPIFNFSPQLVTEIVKLAKPGGVEYLGYTVADVYTEPTFSFLGDSRDNSKGFAVASNRYVNGPTSWTNYIFPPSGSIAETRRVYFDDTGGEIGIVFVTATADTQWRTDIQTLYDQVAPAWIAWWSPIFPPARFFNITNLSSVESSINDMGPVGDSYYTKFILQNTSGLNVAGMQMNGNTLVNQQLDVWISSFEVNETDSPLTVYDSVKEDANFDPNLYRAVDGGRYAVTII